jgi:glycogen synthase
VPTSWVASGWIRWTAGHLPVEALDERHAAGGLNDTVRDEHDHPGAGTGFVFRHPTPDGLLWAAREFGARFRVGGGAWESLLERGMAVDFDWRTSSAPAYVEAYRRAISIRRTGAG